MIGKTGRNWPIRDSRDQLKLITACLRSSGAVALEGSDPNEKIQRSRGNSTNVLRDPHASLHETLFAPREEIEQSAAAAVISPRAGSRPPQRTFTDILGDQDEDGAGSGAPSGRERSQSPSKPIAPKIGAGKNFQPMRLFETEEEGSPATSGKQPGGDPSTPERSRPTERFYRPNPKKYNHFDFADGSDPQDTPKPGVAWEARPKSKHDSTWSFEDFVTPQKTTSTKTLQHHTRHWVAGDEDPAGGAENVAPSGVQRKPRRDAETHFEFRDDGEPPRGDAAQRLPRRPRGAAHNEGLGLYENHVQTPEEDAAAAPADHRPLGNITNLKDRGRDFDAHFVMTDDASAVPGQPARPISEDRMKAVRMMDANWSAYDHSPGPPPASMKENGNGSAGPAKPVRSGGAPRDTGISIAGDGMGSRKGGRGWSIGDESDDEKAAAPVPAKKPGVNKNASSFWDF